MEKFECISERYFGLTDNFSFADVSENDIISASEEVINVGAEAVVILRTNLSRGGIARLVEERTGVPVLDSVVFTAWGAFKAIGRYTSFLAEWGP